MSALDVWVVVGTWVQAVGTVAAVGLALWEGARIRRAQTAQRVVETERARRTHAELVSAWFVRENDISEFFSIRFSNSSAQLAYDVVAVAVLVQGGGPRTAAEVIKSSTTRPEPWAVLAQLPPGESWVKVRGYRVDYSMFRRYGIEVGFTDREGQHWLRRVNGQLEELGESAITYLGLPQPVEYHTIEAE